MWEVSPMNRISKASTENKLFATLDTTVRKVTLQGIPFLLSDSRIHTQAPDTPHRVIQKH